ncbi:MAG: glycosyltransferase family 2 protein [Phycisphaeraceae bacterium]|nr:glycosyltransferase family 2 protein [Phycisphaeraceae bacterium]
MTEATASRARVVELLAPERRAAPALRTPRVAVVIVTWNRREDVSRAIGAVAGQRYPLRALDVVVVDNASTDGTAEHLIETMRPERIVANPTDRAESPSFGVGPGDRRGNAFGFGSLTLVRNTHNLGGCGGFNTGLGYVWDMLDEGGIAAPDYVWLVDDDIDLPASALAELLRVAEADPTVGLVGSRTCDIDDRARTIESTIYLNPDTGLMADEPSPAHPQRGEHEAWARAVGGTRGRHVYTGVRDVDVVSAASLLARWSAVRRVGLWDSRFFIYCDDADWCRRFAGEGYRVVLNLDAVVFHTPWHHKLTPARLYYAQRNLVWLLQKSLPEGRGREVLGARLGYLLRESARSALHRRMSHAEITRRAVDDAVSERGGELEDPSPALEPIADALRRAGALRRGGRVLGVCRRAAHVERFRALRTAVGQAGGDGIRWIEMVRNDVPDAHGAPDVGVRRLVYAGHRLSKLRRQWPVLLRPPRVVVVFDNDSDLPVIRGAWTLHTGVRHPGQARLERCGYGKRLGFAWRWLGTRRRARRWIAKLPAYVRTSRYG